MLMGSEGLLRGVRKSPSEGIRRRREVKRYTRNQDGFERLRHQTLHGSVDIDYKISWIGEWFPRFTLS